MSSLIELPLRRSIHRPNSYSSFYILKPSSRYDFVFAGAGCAALSLLMRMIQNGKFSEKKILLIDKKQKTENDRTWCFWEKGTGFFEDIVYKKWNKLSIIGDDVPMNFDIHPYQYKMIRGIDFYNYCFSEIAKHPNIEIIYGHIKTAFYHKEGITINLDDRMLKLGSAMVFNSFFNEDNERIKRASEINLLQHFRGWLIETATPKFDPGIATFMDFRMAQERGTTFTYVLPFTETKALVEYTLFTESLLSRDEYDAGLRNYISQLLKIDEYRIIEQESGIIPMTTRRFNFYNKHVYHIGTAGGQTKASSGYTFQFIQKQAELITDYLVRDKALSEIPSPPKRFHFYDRVLLDVLCNKRAPGKEIFTTLFKKNETRLALRFLDNETSFAEDLKIISTLPTLPFLKAAWMQL